MTAITHTLAEFAAGISFADLPEEVVARTRVLVLDQIGIAVRARNEAALSGPMSVAIERLGWTGSAVAHASVVGDARGYAPPAAALFNGNLGHSLDFDDTHAPGSIHPSAPIVPAALAAAQMAGAGGREVIAAIVAGYEIQIRLSLALGPTAHYDRGFHPTATCGAFGAAAAAGRVLGLSVEQMHHALGLSTSLAAGSMQFLVDGSWNKPFHTGYAAMNGLVAASMAREGFEGAVEAVEGRYGFLHAYAPDADPAKATAGLGRDWETLRIAVKPYPSCRYSHAAIDGLVALREAHHIDWRDVESAYVGLPATGFRLIGEPAEEKHRPENYVDGQFSMAFCAAVALRDGGLEWDSYARHLGDADTLALCRRVEVATDERPQRDFPRFMAGLVRVRTRAGAHERYVEIAKGEPENFPSAADLRAKFDGLVGPYLEPARADAVARAVLSLEDVASIDDLLALTRPSRAAPMRAAGAGDD